jgi:hypothetical protein
MIRLTGILLGLAVFAAALAMVAGGAARLAVDPLQISRASNP